MNVEKINIDDLVFDSENPRIKEFNVGTNEKDILEILWDEMSVDELVYSIASNGYWDFEPLAVIVDGDKFIVVEGNRRLAAIKYIRNSSIIDRSIPAEIRLLIDAKLVDSLATIPCIIMDSRSNAWRFIGFKHVNGPAKWGSYAKAKYIAEVHNEFGVSLDDIAQQIGDTNKTVQKLYQGLMVLEQAKVSGVYDYETDNTSRRIFFSHLYTGLQLDGVKNYIGLSSASKETPNPVDEPNLENLGQLLNWIYGSKKYKEEKVVKSQNPHLRQLDAVLKNKEAIRNLKTDRNLSAAYELTFSKSTVFEDSLLDAKKALLKARSYLTEGFTGDEDLIGVAASIADVADDLYREMKSKFDHRESRTNRRQ